MVSRKQHVLGCRKTLCLAAVTTLAGLSLAAGAEHPGGKLYADDPLRKEPAPSQVTQVAVRQIDDIFDFLQHSYVTPRQGRRVQQSRPERASDVNTLGEVPDGAWYTNRHAFRRMSIPELQRGPGNATPPGKDGGWTIVGAKSDGVTPGFMIEDVHKNRYLLKFDPPDYPEMCSAADVIGSKFFYALGYFTPENYVVRFRREDLTVPPGATWRDAGGRKHSLTLQTVADLLKAQRAGKDGLYRAVASRLVQGQVVGPFSYQGTRSDDPNDTIPHENRRVLRGLRVFASWLNHQDTRSINTMDTLVTSDERQFLRHYLIDFGSILGSAGYSRKEPWMGHQYTIARPEAAVQTVTFGFYLPRWMRSSYPKLTGVGLFDAESFDPLQWKPAYPNPAFLRMDREDAFWAAKQVAAFSDEEIRAIVETGELSDPRATDWLTKCLIQRRDRIVAAWLSQVLPVGNFRVCDGRLAFDSLDASYRAGSAREYAVTWARYDNDRTITTPLPGTDGTRVPDDGTDEYLAATIGCSGSGEGQCPGSATVYLRRTSQGFDVVGIGRQP